MRTTLPWLGAVLASSLLGGLAQAQAPAPAMPYGGMPYPAYGGTPAPYGGASMPYTRPYPARVAPDMCGPGWWGVNQCGAPYGPNHCVYPPFPPYNGERPSMGGGGGSPAFMTHPFAHGPRDYFMLD
jgi:hypothetical protein